MPTAYPSSLDSYTTKLDGVSDVLAADINNLQDAVVALQTRVGISASGAVVNTTATQTIGGAKTFSSQVTGTASGATTTGAFYAPTSGGAFASMWGRYGAYRTSVSHTGSSYAPSVSAYYEYTGGYAGHYSFGHLATGSASPGKFVLHHINSAGAAERLWSFNGSTGTFNASGGIEFNDGSVQTSAVQLTTDNVRQAMAYVNTGDVGSHALCKTINGVGANPGDLIAGSNLEYATAGGGSGPTVNYGTWRCMGQAVGGVNNPYAITVFLRVV